MHSHQEALSLETLGQLAAGQAQATVNAAISAAIRDTEDRGSDNKPRKIIIEIVLLKLSDDAISAAVKAKTTVPPYVTAATIGELKPDERGRASMVFAPAAPHNPNQPNLPID